MTYEFIGQSYRLYPAVIMPDGKSLEALPGMVCEFDEPPTDGQWVQVSKAPFVPEPAAAPEPEGSPEGEPYIPEFSLADASDTEEL